MKSQFELIGNNLKILITVPHIVHWRSPSQITGNVFLYLQIHICIFALKRLSHYPFGSPRPGSPEHLSTLGWPCWPGLAPSSKLLSFQNSNFPGLSFLGKTNCPELIWSPHNRYRRPEMISEWALEAGHRKVYLLGLISQKVKQFAAKQKLSFSREIPWNSSSIWLQGLFPLWSGIKKTSCIYLEPTWLSISKAWIAPEV